MRLETHLNALFARKATRAVRNSVYHVTNGTERATIVREGSQRLWTVRINGTIYRNSRLSDLRQQIALIGWHSI